MKQLIMTLTLLSFSSLLHAEVVGKAEATSKAKAAAKENDDWGWKNNDGAAYNKRHSIAIKFGPPGVQNGQSNPVSIPPTIADIDVTYLHAAGWEVGGSPVPGITGGVRYRAGTFLYGSVGGGLLFSRQGLGPGLYTALGMSIMRQWPVSLEFEYKQAVGVVHSGDRFSLSMPYAVRVGAAYNW